MLHLSLTIGLFFWPLWSAIMIGFFGSKLGARWSGFFAIFCLLITASLAIYTFILIGFSEYKLKLPLFLCFLLPADIEIFKWSLPHMPAQCSSIVFQLPIRTFYSVYWGFLFDSVTVIMLVVITSISALVHVYAFSYMAKDSHVQRFFACLSLFTFFMLMLVIADNYFQLFVGWEGVGLCSYLLITFWYTRAQANKSALQALVVNKVGDLALVLSLILIFILYKNTAFDFLFLQQSLDKLHLGFYMGPWHLSTGEVIGFLFFIGAVAKSAQLGLHTWLLSAMEGPTPVSALLHAATMVTAGIFLMIRSAPFLNYATNTMFFITILGAITALFAATCGLVQHDIKKIIAFSTCSQLGYMFYSCGLGNYSASLYHLTNHAFFKALLFMGAGAVIHALQGEQDLRRMGGLIKLMPVTYSAMLLASLSLLGFPFLSGFYSKDVLIELAWTHSSLQGTFSFWLAVFAAFLTAFYSTRLLHYVFISNSNGYQHVTKYVHEADFIMLWSFRPLIVGSLFVGYCLRSIFVGFGSTFFASSNLLNNFHLNNLVDSEFLPYYTKLIPVIFSFSGLLLALVIYNNNGIFNTLVNQQRYNLIISEIHTYLNKKWNFDIVYNKGIALNIYDLGGVLYKAGDQGLLEFVGPQGINSFLSSFRFNKTLSPTGYLDIILKGVILYLFFFAANYTSIYITVMVGMIFTKDERKKMADEWKAAKKAKEDKILLLKDKKDFDVDFALKQSQYHNYMENVRLEAAAKAAVAKKAAELAEFLLPFDRFLSASTDFPIIVATTTSSAKREVVVPPFKLGVGYMDNWIPFAGILVNPELLHRCIWSTCKQLAKNVDWVKLNTLTFRVNGYGEAIVKMDVFPKAFPHPTNKEHNTVYPWLTGEIVDAALASFVGNDRKVTEAVIRKGFGRHHIEFKLFLNVRDTLAACGQEMPATRKLPVESLAKACMARQVLEFKKQRAAAAKKAVVPKTPTPGEPTSGGTKKK